MKPTGAGKVAWPKKLMCETLPLNLCHLLSLVHRDVFSDDIFLLNKTVTKLQ